VLTATVGGALPRATVGLPAAANAPFTQPPYVACYIRAPQSSTWQAVGDRSAGTGPKCELARFDFPPVVEWKVEMTSAPVGWTAAYVVVY